MSGKSQAFHVWKTTASHVWKITAFHIWKTTTFHTWKKPQPLKSGKTTASHIWKTSNFSFPCRENHSRPFPENPQPPISGKPLPSMSAKPRFGGAKPRVEFGGNAVVHCTALHPSSSFNPIHGVVSHCRFCCNLGYGGCGGAVCARRNPRRAGNIPVICGIITPYTCACGIKVNGDR